MSLIGGGKACVHGDERHIHIGCREQEETSRARIRLDPSSPVSSLPTSPPVSSLPLSPPVSNSSPSSSVSGTGDGDRTEEDIEKERQRRKEEAAAKRLGLAEQGDFRASAVDCVEESSDFERNED
ncbi:hypothetical protein IGI04_023908 [Brassica rapa subsp. trilocularis]|uniref:Uncharacterized protein n=1 Tax=Brassica rapa subsp. trilocularis TaxID=1813537 RepID=A0ABQ7M573_BRACM|nr:hypothetical protein IGI04_023908 [Brassica rapa subsp. trilocularis]